MYRCRTCSNVYPQYTTCPRCGSADIEMIPDTAYTGSTNAYAPTPAYHKSTGTYVTPASKPATGGKPQGIISMILGIEALISGIVAIICSLVLLDTPKYYSRSYGYYGYYSSYEYSNPLFELLAGYAIGFSIVAIASAIVSICLGFASSGRGNTSKLPTLGKVFSFITLGLSALAFIIAVAEL